MKASTPCACAPSPGSNGGRRRRGGRYTINIRMNCARSPALKVSGHMRLAHVSGTMGMRRPYVAGTCLAVHSFNAYLPIDGITHVSGTMGMRQCTHLMLICLSMASPAWRSHRQPHACTRAMSWSETKMTSMKGRIITCVLMSTNRKCL